MIDKRFLHYETQEGFQADLDLYGEELLYNKIVFIKNKASIWTHGTYYGEKLIIPIVTETIAGLMTPSLYTTLVNMHDEDVPDIKDDIEALLKIISSDNPDITEIINKFEVIEEFINGLEDGSEGAQLLASIIERLGKLEGDLQGEITRAKNKENYLLEQIDNIVSSGTPDVGPSGGDGTKHVFLTQEEYDSLEEYEENTIYFILESESETWTFGGTFPITLS